MQLPLLRVGDFDDGETDAAEHFQVRPRIAANVGDAAEEEDRGLDAALHERARDHEAVAPIAAATAQHADVAGRQVLERRLHGRDRLPAGVLHQHDGRDADLVDRAPIGLTHLLSVEHAHARRAYCLVLDFVNERRAMTEGTERTSPATQCHFASYWTGRAALRAARWTGGS